MMKMNQLINILTSNFDVDKQKGSLTNYASSTQNASMKCEKILYLYFVFYIYTFNEPKYPKTKKKKFPMVFQ